MEKIENVKVRHGRVWEKRDMSECKGVILLTSGGWHGECIGIWHERQHESPNTANNATLKDLSLWFGEASRDYAS